MRKSNVGFKLTVANDQSMITLSQANNMNGPSSLRNALLTIQEWEI